jgi:hypothetical protein
MRIRRTRRYLTSFVVLLAAAGAIFLGRRHRGETEVAARSPAPDDVASAPPVRSPAGERRTASPPPIPPPIAPDPYVSEGPAADEDPRRAEREEKARQERALMAKTWGLSAEEHRRFEAAATAPTWERRAVYEVHLAGELSAEQFQKELEAADARDSKALREVLGSRYEEYTLMRGHFAEAGLDRKPFEPPVYANH